MKKLLVLLTVMMFAMSFAHAMDNDDTGMSLSHVDGAFCDENGKKPGDSNDNDAGSDDGEGSTRE